MPGFGSRAASFYFAMNQLKIAMFCLNFGKEQGVYLNVALLRTSRNAAFK